MNEAAGDKTMLAKRAKFSEAVHTWISSLLAPCADPGCATRQPNWTPLRGSGRRVMLERRWYCAGECLEGALAKLLRTLKTSLPAHEAARHRMPLGLLLVSRGDLDFDQLRRALHAQNQAARGRLGDWLQELGFVTEDKILAALSIQWACPMLKMTSGSHVSYAGLIPHTLQEAYSVLPLHLAVQSRLLYVGFADRIAHRLLYAVDRMLSCRTIPCLLSRSAFKEAIQKLPARQGARETSFESVTEPAEMARIITGYARRCSSDELRVNSSGEYIWARLLRRHGEFNLLFRTA